VLLVVRSGPLAVGLGGSGSHGAIAGKYLSGDDAVFPKRKTDMRGF